MSGDSANEISKAILDFVAADKSMTILELGAGTGVNAIPIVQQGYSVTVIDKSLPMLEVLRAKAGPADNLTILNADASRLPFDEQSFDVVLATNVVHAIENLDVLLDDVARVVKPQGWFLSCHWLTPPSRLEFERNFRRVLDGVGSFDDPMLDQASRISTAMRARIPRAYIYCSQMAGVRYCVGAPSKPETSTIRLLLEPY
jgi:ubiquinone/menaquinone biosynthesis C-methylase UbiE